MTWWSWRSSHYDLVVVRAADKGAAATLERVAALHLPSVVVVDERVSLTQALALVQAGAIHFLEEARLSDLGQLAEPQISRREPPATVHRRLERLIGGISKRLLAPWVQREALGAARPN